MMLLSFDMKDFRRIQKLEIGVKFGRNSFVLINLQIVGKKK
jgi:hypothetical protein